jgi:proteasome assembly chaperone (PAC2) family protein
MLPSRSDSAVYYFTKPKIWLKKGWTVKEPKLVIGYPGIGLIGELVVRFLVRFTNAKKVGFITSPFFSNQVVVDRYGNAKLVGVALFIKNRDEGDLLFALGQKHQEVMGGELETTEILLKLFKKLGGKFVYSVGGHLSLENNGASVWGIASEPEVANMLKEKGIMLAPTGTPIVGGAGIALGLCNFFGLKGIGLLGLTRSEKPDFVTSKAILEKLSSLLNLSIEYSLLEAEEAKWNKMEEKYREELNKVKLDKTLSLLFKKEYKRPEYLG